MRTKETKDELGRHGAVESRNIETKKTGKEQYRLSIPFAKMV